MEQQGQGAGDSVICRFDDEQLANTGVMTAAAAWFWHDSLLSSSLQLGGRHSSICYTSFQTLSLHNTTTSREQQRLMGSSTPNQCPCQSQSPHLCTAGMLRTPPAGTTRTIVAQHPCSERSGVLSTACSLYQRHSSGRKGQFCYHLPSRCCGSR